MSDAGTPFVPAKDLDKGTARVWDIVTGKVREENERPNLTMPSECSSEAVTVSSYSITLKGNFMLVYKTNTAAGEKSDKIAPTSMAKSFIRAHARIQKLNSSATKRKNNSL